MIRWNTRRLSAPEGDPGASNPGTPPAVTPPPAPKQVTVDDLPPEALKSRIEQAKSAAQKELLDSLGITDPAQAKAAIEAARAAEEAKKSNEQRLAEQTLTLANLTAGIDAAVEVFAATITPEQKTAVDAIAGNDKAAWLKAYKALAPTWKAATPVPVTTPQMPPVVAAPPSTSPAPNAPPAADSVSPPNHKAIWEDLKTTNPIQAANYLIAHQREIFSS